MQAAQAHEVLELGAPAAAVVGEFLLALDVAVEGTLSPAS
jgi:hypothetical protein